MKGTHSVLTFAVGLLIGCHPPGDQAVAVESSVSWESTNAPPYDPSHCVEVPSPLVRPVVGALRSESSDRLTDTPIVKIADAEAARLVGATVNEGKALPTELMESFLEAQRARKYRAEVERRDSWSLADQDEFADLTIRFKNNEFARYRAYLVRGVAKNEGTGGFLASKCGGDLTVHHSSLGGSIPPSIRVPVVIFLSQQPQRVFATWSMAE